MIGYTRAGRAHSHGNSRSLTQTDPCTNIIADPHIRAREVLVDLPDKDVDLAPMHNVTPRLSESPGTFRLPAPSLGEHTGELLTELGIGGDEQADLRNRGVI